MNTYSSCLICSVLLLLTGCGQRSSPLTLSPEQGNSLAFLSVSCDVSDELIGKGKVLILKIDNPSDRRLDQVGITFDDAYTAPLQNLRVHRDSVKGSPPPEKSAIRPGENVKLIFSHDVTNHHSMTNRTGTTLPVTLTPTRITIRAEGTSATWRVK